ncbi:efflux RND transporter periplasmic adaptor subunit, partial [bacterium]|nr:efflux RND transporter periplasmic adaptor subunit [bacterium]
NQAFMLCFKVQDSDKDSVHIVSIISDHYNLDKFNDVVVRTQLLSPIYLSFLNFKISLDLSMSVGEGSLIYSLELLDDVIDQKKFLLACMTLVNGLVNKFQCSKVSIAWKEKDYFKTVAISHTETFDKNSEAISELEALFEESADQERIIIVPKDQNDKHLICHSHKSFQRSKALVQVISIPMYVHKIACGVLTIECLDDDLAQKEIDLISIAVNQTSPWLDELYLKERWFYQKMASSVKHHMSWWIGPNQTLLKIFLILSTICLIASCFVKMDFRIEAKARLETDNVAFLSAPFHGFVNKVLVHSGDIIQKGDVLISLDTQELELKELEENANVIRFTREMEKARSNRKLVDMKVAIARVKQSQAELTRIKYYIDQA